MAPGPLLCMYNTRHCMCYSATSRALPWLKLSRGLYCRGRGVQPHELPRLPDRYDGLCWVGCIGYLEQQSSSIDLSIDLQPRAPSSRAKSSYIYH